MESPAVELKKAAQHPVQPAEQKGVMLPSLVASEILQHLSITDLRNARRVCRQWHDLGGEIEFSKIYASLAPKLLTFHRLKASTAGTPEQIVKEYIDKPNSSGDFFLLSLVRSSNRKNKSSDHTTLVNALKAGAKPSLANKLDTTPLHLAAQHGHIEIVRSLVGKGGKPNAANKYGNTPLQLAAQHGHIEIVRLLLQKGAKPNAADNHGKTPLYEAVCLGHIKMLHLLLEKGAKPNAADENGKTPLYEAVRLGRTEIVRLLLEKGADPNALGEDGRTPLHEAVRLGRTEIVRLLLENGADRNAPDTHGNTPLHLVDYLYDGTLPPWANQQGHKEIVRLLGDEAQPPERLARETPSPARTLRWMKGLAGALSLRATLYLLGKIHLR